jgi:hypothetical protein
MINRKNIIVIAIMAIMLMGSVVLSAATYEVYVTSNYPGYGWIELQTAEGGSYGHVDVSYTNGTIHCQLSAPDGVGVKAVAWGTNGLPVGLLSTDSDWEWATPWSNTYLELDLAPYKPYDPTDPNTQ